MNLYRVLSVFRFHQNHNSIQEADCHFILLELIADAKAVIWYQCMIRQWYFAPLILKPNTSSPNGNTEKYGP